MSSFPIAYTGSKRLDVKYIEPFFPENFDTIIEPFAGSAAVSAYVTGRVNKIILTDNNIILHEIYNLWLEGFNILEEYMQNDDNKKKIREHYFGNNIKISKNTTKKENFRQALLDKGSIHLCDWKDKLDQETENTFTFLDPPYFSSSNVSYSLENNSEVDNTKIFIEILHHLRTSPAKVMLVVNKNAITEYIYKDFIIGEYEKTYSRTVMKNGVYIKRKSVHLVIANYSR